MKFKKEYAYLSQGKKEIILKQFHLEVKYSNILRKTTNQLERGKLYYQLYSKFFNEISEHPMLNRTEHEINNRVNRTINFLSDYISPSSKLIEIGAGDCSVTIGLAPLLDQAMGVDVAKNIMPNKDILPKNVNLFVSEDGITLPSKKNYFDIAYSNQLLEHLHLEDSKSHLINVYNLLATDGYYIFNTPHRFFGPHDVSVYFYNISKGFHLKEYCNYELYILLKKAGFSKINLITGIKGRKILLPIFISILVEFLLVMLPYKIRKYLSLLTPFRKCLNGHIIAKK